MATSPLFILYGSATGNAEHIAKDLASSYQALLSNKDADTFFPSVVCCELDQYKKKCQAIWDDEPAPDSPQIKHGVLIVTSTTGNGDAPENASRFVRFVKRKTTAASEPFKNCAYAVLGLGDTNYDQFCNTGKIVDKKMAELGGQRITPLVCADEATGLEDAVDPWVASIFTKVTVACRSGVSNGSVSTAATNTVKTVDPDATLEEEKKMEVTDQVVSSAVDATSSSVGVRTVRSLLGIENSGVPFNTSPPSVTLPSFSASRLSSFALVDDRDEASGRSRSDSVSSTDSGGFQYSYQQPYEAPVTAARYLTQTPALAKFSSDPGQATASIRSQFSLQGEAAIKNGKRIIEITLGLPDESFDYKPGDAIGMVMQNTAEDVDFVLEMLQKQHGLTAKQKISLDGQPPITVTEAVQKLIDLTWHTLKNKKILYSLAQEAMGDEKYVLEWLSSTAGEAVFDLFIAQQRQSVVDLMKKFPTLQRISLESLLGTLPPLAPRYYSVTSSPLIDRKSLTIALAVVDYLTPSLVIDGKEMGHQRVGGLASQFLESLVSPLLAANPASVVPATIPIFPKPTEDFHLPEFVETPLILIGPGTGVAPFIGFLQHRRALVEKDNLDAGSVDVFFGCRHRDHDFLYQCELEDLLNSGVLSRLHTAFSRETVNKVYVQDLMVKEHSDLLRESIFRKQASIYICGDGNYMAKAVQQAIQSILEEELGTTETAVTYMKQMKKDKRLLLDIWS